MEFCIFYCFDFICFYFISIFYDLFFHFQLFSVDLYKSSFFFYHWIFIINICMHFFPSCACVTILTKKPNKTVSTKNHQYLQYSNVMNNTSGALRMIQTNTKYQNTYWTLEQLKKKTKYTQQIKMKRQHITLIHKKNLKNWSTPTK